MASRTDPLPRTGGPGGRWRRLGWAAASVLLAPLAFGLTPPRETLELPEVVVRGIDRVRLEARRQGVLTLEAPRIAEMAVQLDLPADVLPSPELRAAPPVASPGCTYRNPVTGAIARAAKGPEALYKTALERLSRERLDEAAFYLAQLRSDHPAHPNADDAAFWLAEINRRNGRVDEAVAYFRLVTGSYADEAAYRLAWLLDAEGRGEEARRTWERVAAERGSPHRPEALYRVGVTRLEAGDPAAAIVFFQDLLALAEEQPGLSPELEAAALLAQGLGRKDSGDLPGAEHSLMRFLLRYPDHPSATAAQIALGWVLLDQGKNREADLRFEWVLNGSPPPALKVRALYGRVRAVADEADAAAAAENLAALEISAPDGPWLAWGRADLGWLAFRQGRFQVSVDWYRSSLEAWVGPGSDVPRYMSAEGLYLGTQYELAAGEYDRVPPDSPLHPAALHRAGLCLLLAGNPAEAVVRFERVLDRYPAYPDSDRVWAWLGEARTRLGQADRALQALLSVPQTSPAYPQALYGRAWIAFETERWDAAADLFQRFLSAAPGDDPNRLEALLNLARAHFNRRELRAALDTLDRLAAASPDGFYAAASRFYRGWMLARSGREAVGREILEQLLAAEPSGAFSAQAQQALAWLDFGKGDYRGALHHFEAVLALAPGGAIEEEARHKRADCLYNLGRYQQALEAYRELGEGPDGDYGIASCLHRLGEIAALEVAAVQFSARYPHDPRSADLFLSLAQAKGEAGDALGAAAAYQDAARLGGETAVADEARLEAARSLKRAGDVIRALAILTPLTEHPDSVGLSALREVARIHEASGAVANALATWDRIVARTQGQDRVEAYRAAAHWARVALDWEGAERRLREALGLAPAPAEAVQQSILADLGEVHLLAGRPGEAMAPLAQAAEMGSSADGLRAFVALGKAQEAAGQPEQALETYLRIGYLYPLEDGTAAQSLLRAGRILETRGSPSKARAVYEKVAADAGGEAADQARNLLRQLGAAPPD